MLSQKIYAISTHNYRTFRLPEDCFQGRKGTGGLSQSGTYEHRVHAGKLFFNLCRRVRAEGTIRIRKGKNNCLIQLHCLNGINALRHPQKYQTRPGAKRAHCGQIRASGIAPAAAQKKDPSKIPFMSIGTAVRQQCQSLIPGQFHHRLSSHQSR